MTKRIFNAIIAVMAIVLLSACTHNDGNIGHWFGSWKLRQITINGENDEAYQGNVFWKFQSEVVQMSQLNSYHGRTDAWGSWKEVDAEGNLFRLPISNRASRPSRFSASQALNFNCVISPKMLPSIPTFFQSNKGAFYKFHSSP